MFALPDNSTLTIWLHSGLSLSLCLSLSDSSTTDRTALPVHHPGTSRHKLSTPDNECRVYSLLETTYAFMPAYDFEVKFWRIRLSKHGKMDASVFRDNGRCKQKRMTSLLIT
ncbi:hypothetical protein LSH36_199g04052 [Paralvinella palmiformis]|uniref:Secreted protein n=1 Tax=Paralvinella palmiformis TaxID=53620 RepID=A0AAD9N7M1_9ANNE|nr:hypothetical protein LSH36_199g04052 [Paralvinella palmiformis]